MIFTNWTLSWGHHMAPLCWNQSISTEISRLWPVSLHLLRLPGRTMWGAELLGFTPGEVFLQKGGFFEWQMPPKNGWHWMTDFGIQPLCIYIYIYVEIFEFSLGWCWNFQPSNMCFRGWLFPPFFPLESIIHLHIFNQNSTWDSPEISQKPRKIPTFSHFFPRNSAFSPATATKVPWHPPKPKARPVGPQPTPVAQPSPVQPPAPVAQHWWDWNAWDEHAAKRLGLRMAQGLGAMSYHVYMD